MAAHAQARQIVAAPPPGAVRLDIVGWGVAAMCVLSALLFRTYSSAIPMVELEAARQIGVPFVVLELLIIVHALRSGLNLRSLLGRLDLASRCAVILMLGFVWVGTVLTALAPVFAVVHATLWTIHLLFAVSLYHVLAPVTARSIVSLAAGQACCLLLLVPVIAVHFAFPPAGLVSPDPFFGWGIAVPGFISGRLFGALCGAVLALLIGLVVRESRAGRVVGWHYAAVTLAAGMMIWSGTRGAIVGVGGATVIGLAVARTVPSAAVTARLILCLIVSAVLATALLPYDDPYFRLIEPKDFGSGNAASGGRLNLWHAAVSAIQAYPLFGAGDGALPMLVPEGVFPHMHPHNVVLQFLLNWGVIAGTAGLYLIARAAWRAHLVVWSRPWLMPVLMMLDTLLIMALFDGILYFSQFVVIALIGFASILASGRAEPSR